VTVSRRALPGHSALDVHVQVVAAECAVMGNAFFANAEHNIPRLPISSVATSASSLPSAIVAVLKFFGKQAFLTPLYPSAWSIAVSVPTAYTIFPGIRAIRGRIKPCVVCAVAGPKESILSSRS
jgi:hypothetical protein